MSFGNSKWGKFVRAMLPLQGGLCWWCGELPIDPTAEHLMPKSLGGSDAAHNIAVACRQCNWARDNDITWQEHPNLVGTRRHALLGKENRELLLIAMGPEWWAGLPQPTSHIRAWNAWVRDNAATDPRAALAWRSIQGKWAAKDAARVSETCE